MNCHYFITIILATITTLTSTTSHSNYRERQKPRHLRTNDLRIAYLSQQQLRSFNLPYQLGFSDIPEHKGTFETPDDSDTGNAVDMS